MRKSLKSGLFMLVTFATASIISFPTFAGNWKQEGLDWKYYDNNGKFARAWIEDGGSWYYLDPVSGNLKTGWIKDESGKWYFLNPVSDGKKGEMKTGWIKDGGSWYYLDPISGNLKTGWIKDKSGKWYFLNPVSNGNKGSMLTGWQWIDGNCYYFEQSGDLLTNNISKDGYKVDKDGKWIDKNGKAVFIRNKGISTAVKNSSNNKEVYSTLDSSSASTTEQQEQAKKEEQARKEEQAKKEEQARQEAQRKHNTIKELEALDDISVNKNISKEDLKKLLPKKVKLIMEDASTREAKIDVKDEELAKVDTGISKEYMLNLDYILPDGVLGAKKPLSIKVIVKQEITITSITPISEIVGEETDNVAGKLPKTIELNLSNGQKQKVAVKSKKFNPEFDYHYIGSYEVELEYDLPEGVSGNKPQAKVKLTITKASSFKLDKDEYKLSEKPLLKLHDGILNEGEELIIKVAKSQEGTPISLNQGEDYTVDIAQNAIILESDKIVKKVAKEALTQDKLNKDISIYIKEIILFKKDNRTKQYIADKIPEKINFKKEATAKKLSITSFTPIEDKTFEKSVLNTNGAAFLSKTFGISEIELVLSDNSKRKVNVKEKVKYAPDYTYKAGKFKVILDYDMPADIDGAKPEVSFNLTVTDPGEQNISEIAIDKKELKEDENPELTFKYDLTEDMEVKMEIGQTADTYYTEVLIKDNDYTIDAQNNKLMLKSDKLLKKLFSDGAYSKGRLSSNVKFYLTIYSIKKNSDIVKVFSENNQFQLKYSPKEDEQEDEQENIQDESKLIRTVASFSSEQRREDLKCQLYVNWEPLDKDKIDDIKIYKAEGGKIKGKPIEGIVVVHEAFNEDDEENHTTSSVLKIPFESVKDKLENNEISLKGVGKTYLIPQFHIKYYPN